MPELGPKFPTTLQDIHLSYLDAVEEVKTDFQIRPGESNDKYIERVKPIWANLFKSQGGVYLRPHHFTGQFSNFRWVNRTADKRTTSIFSSDILAGAIEDAYTDFNFYDRSTSLLAHAPMDAKYSHDVLGPNNANKQAYILNNAAMLETVTEMRPPFIIAVNPFKDPYCLAAGTFGCGLHCRLDLFRSLSKKHEKNFYGDLEILNEALSILEKNQGKRNAIGKAIKNTEITWCKETFLASSWFKIDYEAAIGEAGKSLHFRLT